MFDIGWTELLVVACVAIIVVGPKDLPKMLRTIGKAVGNMKRMAGDFQRQFDDAMNQAELDEVKKLASGINPLDEIKKSAAEFGDDVKKQMNTTDSELKAAASDKTVEKAAPEELAPALAADVKKTDELPAPEELAPALAADVSKPAVKKASPKQAQVKKAAIKKTPAKKAKSA